MEDWRANALNQKAESYKSLSRGGRNQEAVKLHIITLFPTLIYLFWSNVKDYILET